MPDCKIFQTYIIDMNPLNEIHPMPIQQLYPFTALIIMNPVESIGVQLVQWLDVLAYDRHRNNQQRGRINYLPIDIDNESATSRRAREKVKMWTQALYNCQDVQRFISRSKQCKIRLPTDELERAGYRVEFTRFGDERMDVSIHLTRTNEILACETLFTGYYANKSGDTHD